MDRYASDVPTIGMILSNNRIIVEYALCDVKKPTGIATYLTEALPDTLRDGLPDVESLEGMLTDIDSKKP